MQDILSLETPVTEKQLEANKIVILSFGFKDSLKVKCTGNIMIKTSLLKIAISVSVELDYSSILILIIFILVTFSLLFICIKDRRLQKFDFSGLREKNIKKPE